MKLKDFIDDMKLTQRELAGVLNLAPSHVSLIVSGKRNLTGMHIRLLIERFGYDVVSRYADPSELPVNYVNVNAPVIHGNNNPVNGSGSQNVSIGDAGLVEVITKQAEQISALISQQERLISLLEKQQNSL